VAVDTSGGHPAMDYKEHVRTYSGFLRGTALMVGHIIVILILMAIVLL
jgi:hypothetical protein